MIRIHSFNGDKQKDKETQLIRKLKTRSYFCTKCKNWHKFEEENYKKHVKFADEVME